MVRVGVPNVKGFVVLIGAAIVGNMVAEKFLLKAGPDDPDGFIEVKPGLGLDDVARGAAIAGVYMVAKRFLG